MAQKSFTLTLTRWHHVAARIKALAKSKLEEAQQTLGGTVVDNPLTAQQIQALEARGKRALDQLQEGLSALEAVGKIRRALAEANGKHGVAAMLAEAEEKRARARALDSFAQIDLLSATPIANVNDALAKRSSERSVYHGGIRVSTVDIGALDFVREQRRALEAQAAAITDQVAELNRTTISIELDEDLAKEVGL